MTGPQESPARFSRILRHPIVWSVGLGLIVAGTIAYSLVMGNGMVARYAPMMDAAMEITHEAAIAHLWFEQIINGGRYEEIDVVWDALDRSMRCARVMLEGGEKSGIVFIPIRDPELHQKISDVQRRLEIFRAIAEERWRTVGESGIGTGLDQRFDALFEELLDEAEEVKAALQRALAKDLRRFQMLQGFLIVICLVLSVLAGTSFQRYRRRRARHIAALRASEEGYRTLFEATPAGVVAIQDDRIVYVNDAAASIVGASDRDAFIGQNVEAVIKAFAPQSSKMMMDRLRRSERGESNPRIEIEIVRADGSHGVTASRSVGITLGGRPAMLQVFQDITGRKLSETKLRESEEKFSVAFHRSPYPMAISEIPSGKLVEVNRAMETMSGCTAGEAVGRTVVELGLLSGDERERVFKIVQEGGGVRGLEVEFRDRAGTPIHALYNTNIVDIGGKPHLLTVIENITKRKKAEEAFRESERVLRERQEMIRALVETSQDWIWAIDLRGSHTYSNPAVEDILGYRPEELVAKSSLDLMHEDDRKLVEEMLPACIADRKGWSNFLIRWRHKDGSWRFLESNAVPILDAEGDLAGFRGVDRDITGRKRADENLKDSEECFRRLVEQSPLGIEIMTPDGKMSQVNPAFVRLWGIPQELLPQVYEKYNILSDEQARELGVMPLIEKAFAGEPVIVPPFEYDARRTMRSVGITKAEGAKRWIQAHLYPVKGASGKILNVVLMFEDITEVKQAEQSLRALAAELSTTEERERHRIATYLHDQIGQSLAVTQMKVGALSEKAGAGHLRESVQEIGALLEEAMDDTRTVTFDLSPPILYELGLSAALEWFGEMTAEKHGLQFSFSDDGRAKSLDPEMAALIFRNVRELMVNVVKHAAADRLTASFDLDDGDLRIVIEDDGAGFDVSEISSAGRIAGFGLFSIRERMRAIGGRLELESSPARGTRATLSLPLDREYDPSRGA